VKCPFCGDIGDKVVDSRESREGDVIRRRRQCLNDKCKKRFTSYERIEEIPYMVVKKDGTRERFERSKLVAGLLKACEKRPIAPLTSTTSPIARQLLAIGPSGVARTWRAGDVRLKNSIVAYVRSRRCIATSATSTTSPTRFAP
jgi:transcriptional regulator NrdR